MGRYSRSRSRGRRGRSQSAGAEKPKYQVPSLTLANSTQSDRWGRPRENDWDDRDESDSRFEIKLTNDDAAFILGKGGKTKAKIARVSGCKLDLREKDLLLVGDGKKSACARAKKYAKCLMQQRTGPVTVSTDLDDGDLTLIAVPQDAVGFVTGKKGNFLRSIEDEWRVLMFFAECDYTDDKRSSRKDKEFEQLAIFGTKRDRRGAELKVYSVIETKHPGFFEKWESKIIGRDEGDWKTEVLKFQTNDELSFALGKQGATRRKLELSSGCITQYIGKHALFAGTRDERTKVKEYLKWMFDELDRNMEVPNIESRDDISTIGVPQDCVGYVTGAKRQALSQVEQEFGVLMFFTGKSRDNERRDTRGYSRGRELKERKEREKQRAQGAHKDNFETLVICGPPDKRRYAELRVMWSVELKTPGYFSDTLEENKNEWKKSGFGTDIVKFIDSDIGYMLGQKGITRQKIAKASGAELQYIGNFALVAGYHTQRSRCREYLDWLLRQRDGKIEIPVKGRLDYILPVDVPEHCIGWVTGKQGTELRKVEAATSTFCFLAVVPDSYGGEKERLLICGEVEGTVNGVGRLAAQRLVEDLISEKERIDRDGGGRRGAARGSGGSRRSRSREGRGKGRSNSRKRSPSRRHSRSRKRSASRSRGRKHDRSASRSRGRKHDRKKSASRSRSRGRRDRTRSRRDSRRR